MNSSSKAKKATLSTYQGYPAILLPVNTTPVDELLQIARDDIAAEDHTYAEESTGEGEEEATYKYYLYLWYDYEEGKCTFEAATNQENEYNSRLLMRFEVSTDKMLNTMMTRLITVSIHLSISIPTTMELLPLMKKPLLTTMLVSLLI